MNTRALHRFATAATLAVALTGCSSPPQRNETATQYPAPSQWSAPARSGDVAGDWWRTLGSTSLVATIEEALTANHDLRAAIARVDSARALARIAGADLQPQAGFGFDAGRQQRVFVGLPIPGAGDDPLVTRFNNYAATFTVSWELDVWGRLRAGQGAALADVQATESDVAGARDSLAARVARAWSASVEARRQLELARATSTNFTTLAAQVRSRYERGLRPALDLRLALANEAAARAGVANRTAQFELATRQLEILLGRYPAGVASATDELVTTMEPVPAGLPSELLERRPDLVAAERRLSATTERVREAKAALLPRLALTASGGRSSGELDDLLDNSFTLWSLAANLAQPIYQGGRLRANVELAKARSREATEGYLGAVLGAFGEVETALADEGHLAERETELARAAAQSQAALRLAEDRYAAGLEQFITLLESQRRAYEAESQLLTVRRARLDNRVQLHLALGGGFVTPTVKSAQNSTTP